MKNFFIIFFAIVNCHAFAQNDVEKANKIDKEISKIKNIGKRIVRPYKIKLDSVSIKIKKYKSIVNADSYFEKSKSKLNLIYYLANDSLKKVVITENSPSNKECYYIRHFYYENGNVFYKNEGSSFPFTYAESGGDIPKGEKLHEILGYNKFLSKEFLEKFVDEIYARIKNNR